MSYKFRHSKLVVICFRGFQHPVDDVERAIGKISSSSGVKGDPVKHGVKTILKRSYVRYSLEIGSECSLDEVIFRIFEYMGGIDKIHAAIKFIIPEFLDIDITLPVKGSEDQAGAFISHETLVQITSLQATLSFRFV